jgi:hypothetical protein
MFAPPAPSADDFADLFASQAIASQETAEERLVRLIETGKHQSAVRELVQLRSQGTHELSQVHLAMLIRDLRTWQSVSESSIESIYCLIRRICDRLTTPWMDFS